MTIRIFPRLWEREMCIGHGAPGPEESARALAASGYCVVVHPDSKRMSDTEVAVSFDTDEEGLAVLWLVPEIDRGTMQ